MPFELPLIHWLVLLSVVISLFGGVAYIRDTLVGRSQPNRVSWFLWGIVPMLGVVAALSAHADPWVTLRTFIAGVVPLLIFVSSFFNKSSYWKLEKFDFFCGATAVFALVLWAFTDSPQLAILFLALADLFAVLPTLSKAWKYPETETGFTYFMGLISVLLVLPSIPLWNIENSAFQVYLLVANLTLAFSVYRKKLFGFLEWGNRGNKDSYH